MEYTVTLVGRTYANCKYLCTERFSLVWLPERSFSDCNNTFSLGNQLHTPMLPVPDLVSQLWRQNPEGKTWV